MLQPGSPIPPLAAPDAAVSLAAGKHHVLYFFPKAGTPACTMEACSFRDNLALLREHGAEVIGVSPDAPEAQAAFAQKYALDFPLLSDADGAIAQAFGTATQQLWAGKTFQSVSRTTFLIDEDGIVRKVWEHVDPRVHVQEVVAALGALAENKQLQARLEEARAIAQGPVESPFATARLAEARMADVRRRESIDEATGEIANASVDRDAVMGVLDMLRPFMQADGGDVELAGIEAGIVKVRLQGACGTCPSSTVTLRMGIEAQLKQRVPGVLGVEAVF
ncbi:putative peroxiredoxin bcp [compost metagenome]